MPAKLQPRKFLIQGCNKACSLNEAQLPGELARWVHQWYEEGNNDALIHKRILEMSGVNRSYGAIGRHRANHLVPLDQTTEVAFAPPPKVDHVEVLEQIIAMGARGVQHAKITPDLVLKAMDMHFKMTQGKELAGFMQDVATAMAGMNDEPIAGENEDAIRTPDEQVMALASVE